jgi:cholesterol transport system auxiliary component
MTRLATLVAAILCLTSAACVGGRPIHYYTIDHPAASAAAPRPDGLVLLVARITAPEVLQDSRIRYRSGGNEVGAYEYHRWTERPGLIVQELLLRTLRASGKYRQVQEASTAAAGDYLVRGKLYEFSEIDEPGIHTRVSLRIELVDRKTAMVVWDRDYVRDEPVDGKSMKYVVVSLEQNLKHVIGDAASGVEAFLSNPSPGGDR